MKFWQVDAFTNQPFCGNPAMVTVVNEFPSTSFMQSLAYEFNLSETVFVVPRPQEANNLYDIRWFSPRDEAPLCGHATLAAAHVLWEASFAFEERIQFRSRAGSLFAERQNLENGEIKRPWIELDFPAKKTHPVILPPEVECCLKTQAIECYRDQDVYILFLDSLSSVQEVRPNFEMIKTLDIRALIVTAPGDQEYDFVSRYFAPKVGIPEDPVCGSAHCRLVPLWSQKTGKTEFLAYQSSERGGVLRCRLLEDRVILGGQSITISTTNLLIDSQVEAAIPLIRAA